jgi:plasmid stabilization system protein ParE
MGLIVYWTHFAENKLEDVYNYYRDKAGEIIAIKLIDGIVLHSLRLEIHPYMGQKELLFDDNKHEIRYLVYKTTKLSIG